MIHPPRRKRLPDVTFARFYTRTSCPGWPRASPLFRHGILLGPFSRSLDGRLFVILPALGDVGREGIVGVRSAQQSLDR